jgi:putative acetyltransferase
MDVAATYVRPARKGDGVAILTVHRRAIHEIACADYPPEILDAWGAPIPENELVQNGADFERKLADGDIALVAEVDGVIAGFGEITPAKRLLLAIYVSPDFKRRGVGRAILRELERIAGEGAVPYLQMDSSLTAESFYLANGYTTLERGFHTLRNGGAMACVKMKKDLACVA